MKVRLGLTALGACAVMAAIAVGVAWAAADAGTAVPGAAADALSATRFSISIDGKEIGSFSGLTGISSGADAAEYVQTGSTGQQITKSLLPASRKLPSVVLSRGLTTSLEISAWHQSVLAGQLTARKNVSLVMYGADGKPVARYHLENAWPSKLDVTGLKAGSAQLLMETVTIVSERIQRVSS
jgi:phage tail-like protein